MYVFVLGLYFLILHELGFPVPSPDSTAILDPWIQPAALGVRVNLLASEEIGSGIGFSLVDMSAAK